MLKLQSNVVRALKCSSRCNFYFLNLYETIKTLVFFFPKGVESNDINFEAWMVEMKGITYHNSKHGNQTTVKNYSLIHLLA
ncbi:hypothetical protein RchiOBHm_Chr3g0485941 [Rosa chinensis]|uniref:Uncharacterized protein n=1 Tax=Rosa chinensis TaxID=74649 RepID=A0A2P6RF40_ROSCH|nr:hypothetical protein RchiOBHm_Chr3g0485941 [Rosa chinensis]